MMRHKQYICITPFFPTPSSFRGPFVYDQVRAIAANSDYQVLVFRPKPWGRKVVDYEYGGVKVHYFDTIDTPSYILHGIFNGINARLFMRRVYELGINPTDVAVAHGHTAQFATYALALKAENPQIKAVVQHHDPDPFTIRNGRWARKPWNAMFRVKKNIDLLERVDLSLCISEFVKDSLLSFPDAPQHLYNENYREALQVFAGMKRPCIKDTYLLYNGVDCDKFYVENVQRNKTPFTIGCIANFIDWKDQITLLRAVKTLVVGGETDIRLVLVGSGVTLGECEHYMVENALDEYVEIRKEVDHTELRAFYNSIDLYVQPSYFEGFGCVCTEAAACGVPFMICKHQGAAEYISLEEEVLWLFEPHNYHSLAEKILYYKANRPKQNLVHSYDINVLVKVYLDYVGKI